MSRKFNPILEEKRKEQDKKRREQKKYREKLNLPDDQPIIVEKERVGSSLIKMLTVIGRVVIWTVLIGLAIIGAVALVYPKTRDALMQLIPVWSSEIKNNLR